MNNNNFASWIAVGMDKIKFLLFGIIILSCYQCANIVPPKGGPKDVDPPRIDSLNSSDNFQINYKNDPIILSFDEWIVLENIFDQVVISPPTEYPLDIRLKKKSILINFDDREILKENTTYTINFGSAVKDFSEGNIPTNLRYVLSTGAIIDSLEIKAKLIDIKTKRPVENGLLMLYTNLADSVLYKTKPYYFAKSDTGGVATIQNVRSDIYKVVAIER